MACADIPMDILEPEEVGEEQKDAVIRYYQASKLVPAAKGPFHALLNKQPGMYGSLQIISGAFSVAVGVVFTTTQNMNKSLFTLFRVSHLTGLLFFIAGLLSNMLFRYPRLVPVCFFLNCGCVIVASVGVALISIDLVPWNSENEYFKVELLQLCVLVLDVFLSIVLCCCLCKYRS